MTERRAIDTLRGRGLFWTIGALATGVLASWLWMSSQSAWQNHLNRAYVSGLTLYQALVYQSPTPDGVSIRQMRPEELWPGNDPVSPGFRARFYVTSVSILTGPENTLVGSRLQLQIVSEDLRYPVADIPTDDARTPAQKAGGLTRLLASYCTEPTVYARLDEGTWNRVDGSGIWGCAAAPSDLRLLALIVFGVGVAVWMSLATETAAQFTRFARALGAQGRFGRRETLPEEGPQELRDIAAIVNDYVGAERERLQKRALVLSGVSHDLGTPATRLRLRTALIGDEELRSRLESDIDQMTGMIESVLTYTRAEISTEEVVKLSLTALVESVVADYADVGKPVTLRDVRPRTVGKTHSVFGGSGRLELSGEDARRVLIMARPLSLRRAISNLIDNALKYGRRAAVSVEADSGAAAVIIEDEGTSLSEVELDKLTGPFLRGENAGLVSGVGLGLTIVSTIARQHGGDLEFERVPQGLRAILKISRA